jgi:hypothetical protein
MKEQFIYKNFGNKALETIQKANAIIAEYQAAGLRLTLRQLYYQFVARGYIPNKQTSYDNLGKLISDARLCGYIDWDALEDRTRFLRGHTTYNSPGEAIAALRRRYRVDMWEGQETRVECWIEKDALIGVIEQVCGKWDVDYFACRGYASQSELYNAGKRIAERRNSDGQETLVIHLGDHDPSGLDMTRDNEDRLSMFAGAPVEVIRVALNMNQVQQYDPPPNPTKMTDCRANKYVEEYGDESWELDALEPKVIAALIEKEVRRVVSVPAWNKRVEKLKSDVAKLDNAVKFVNDDADKEDEE